MDNAAGVAFSVVAAAVCAREGGGGGHHRGKCIGTAGGRLPWPNLHGDMAFFRELTTAVVAETPEEEGRNPGTSGQRRVRLRNAVVMGRVTWESIPPARKPLAGRLNVVLSSTLATAAGGGGLGEGGVLFLDGGGEGGGSFAAAMEKLWRAKAALGIADVFVIGGARVFADAVAHPGCRAIYLTEVFLPGHGSGGGGSTPSCACDAFFPDIPLGEDPYVLKPSSPLPPIHTERGIGYRFMTYVRTTAAAAGVVPLPAREGEGEEKCVRGFAAAPPSSIPLLPAADKEDDERVHDDAYEEEQYLSLVASLLRQHEQQQKHGEGRNLRPDRTGTGVIGGFGAQMRFSLRGGSVPLLTTKRMFWKGIVEELLWMVAGSTSAAALSARGVRIWDANGSRAALDARGLFSRAEGDLGPIYGFQWRHFGAKYTTADADYAGQGVDQLADCIDKIRRDPYSRRIVMSAWNPADLDAMALQPCHVLCQFYVSSSPPPSPARGDAGAPPPPSPSPPPPLKLSCAVYQRSCDLGLGVPFNIASYALLTHMVAHVCNAEAAELIYTLGDYHVYSNHVDALRSQIQRRPRAPPRVRIEATAANVSDIGAIATEHIQLEGYDPHPSLTGAAAAPAMPMAV